MISTLKNWRLVVVWKEIRLEVDANMESLSSSMHNHLKKIMSPPDVSILSNLIS